MQHMRKYNKKLGKNALMTPHILVWVCRYCTDPGLNCKQIGNVVYCPPPSRETLSPRTSVIDMGLDELCIYDMYKDKDNAETWWEYMDNIRDCQESNYSPECLDKAKKKADIDRSRLNTCLTRSGDILLHEYGMWQSSGIPYNPAVVINNHVYRVIHCLALITTI